jgi:hypothetical protein
MKRTSSLTVVLAALVSMVTTSASSPLQAPVDFSGRWVLESGSLPSAPAELNVRQQSGEGGRLRQVIVTRHGPNGSSTETLHVGMIGGTVPGSGGGPRTFRRVAWEDSTLVVEVETLRAQTGDRAPSEQRREAWSVTPEGRLQIVVTESGPSRTTQTTTLLYRQVKEGRFPPIR